MFKQKITIRRCEGDKLAWTAVVGPKDWSLGTDTDLAALIERIYDRHPADDIRVALDKDSEDAARAQRRNEERSRIRLDLDRARQTIAAGEARLKELAS